MTARTTATAATTPVLGARRLHAASKQTRADRAHVTRALLQRAHSTSDVAERTQVLDEVVVANRHVALAIAARYRGRGVALDDLEQIALEALIKAVRRFDPAVRDDLLTYAVPTIRGEVQRYFRDHGWMIRPPRRVQELQWRLNQGLEALRHDLGRDPSRDELGQYLDCSPSELTDAFNAFGAFAPTSLDWASDDGSWSVADTLVVTDTAATATVDDALTLGTAMRGLTASDRELVRLFFYEGLTRATIGRRLDLSQNRVSRRLTHILTELRLQLCADDQPTVLTS